MDNKAELKQILSPYIHDIQETTLSKLDKLLSDLYRFREQDSLTGFDKIKK